MAPEELKSDHNSPLTNVDLRHNRLKGSIILGNYEVTASFLSYKLSYILYPNKLMVLPYILQNGKNILKHTR